MLLEFVREIFHGFCDSLKGIFVILQYDNLQFTSTSANAASAQHVQNTSHGSSDDRGKRRDYLILPRVFQCSILNGVIYGLSMICFNYMLLPVFGWLLTLVLEETKAFSIWNFMQPLLTMLFELIWLVPLFLVSKIINIVWYQDIADNAFRQRQGRPQIFPSLSAMIADTTLSVVIQVLFLIQTNLMKFFPVFGVNLLLCTVHMSLLNALYCFEYRWFNMAWPLNRRLKYIEVNWPYFVGFGFPLSCVAIYFSSILTSGCLFAVLFPFFIISANEAVPSVTTCAQTFPIFKLSVWLSSKIAYICFSSSASTLPPRNQSPAATWTPTRKPNIRQGHTRRSNL